MPLPAANSNPTSPSQLFLSIDDELRDIQRVQSHGQEEDLRQALQVVINRVGELSTKLKEAYKDQAELETSLNLAKSNLQLVQSNNEMLEEALKRDTSGSKDVGWRRASARDTEHRFAEDIPRHSDHVRADASPALFSPPISGRSAMSLFSSGTPASGQDSRFFKFRFTNGSLSRPTTPNTLGSPALNGYTQPPHPVSPSLPPSPSQVSRELEELNAELQRERAAHKAALKQKADLEAEIESLSQALFEEANKMVRTERLRRAETEEELKETRLEKEALKSALRVVEGENGRLRCVSGTAEAYIPSTESPYPTRSRSSSRNGIKSRPSSSSSAPSSPESFKFALDAPSSAPTTYPPSPPPEPSDSTPVASPAPASEDLASEDPNLLPSSASFQLRAFADAKRKPENLKSASLFPTAPSIS